jgi:chemotaxis protein MotB
LEAEVEALKTALERAETAARLERETWDGQRQALETRLAEVQGREKEAQSSRTALEQALTAAREDARRALADAASAKEESSKEIESLRSDVAAENQRRQARLGQLEVTASRAAELAAERDVAAARAAELEAERAQWDAERVRLADLEGLATTARDEADGLRAEQARLRAELTALRETLDGRQTALDAAAAHAAELEAERAQWAPGRARLAELETERIRWDAERTSLDATRQALEGRLAAAEAANRDLDARLDTALSARRDLEARLAAESGTRLELQRQLNSVEGARQATEERLATAEVEREEAAAAAQAAREQDRRAFEVERSAWNADRDELERRLAELAESATNGRGQLTAQRDEARKELELERGRHGEAQREWESVRASLEAARDVLEAARQAQEGRIADLERAADDAGRSHRALLSERDELRAALDETRERRETDRQEWQSAWAAWDTDRQELESRITSLNRMRHELEVQVGALSTTQQELNQHLGSLEQLKQQLEQRLRETSAGLEGAVEAHRQDREAWQRERDARLAEADELRQQLDQLRAGFDADRNTWDAARHDLEVRLRDLEAQAQVLSDLEAQLHEAREAARIDAEAWQRARADFEQQVTHLSDQLAAASARQEAERRAFDDRVAELSSERARRESELEARLADLGAQFESAAGALARLSACELFGYAVTTAEGHLTECNATFARLFGHADVDEAMATIGQRPFPGLSAAGRSLGSEGPRVPHVECMATTGGHELRVLHWTNVVSAADPSLVRLEHVLVDMTREAGRDEQLRDLRRLGQVGTLTALMAPDVQGVVASLRHAADHLASARAVGDDGGDLIASIQASAARADGLVQQLTAFTRRNERPLDRCHLDDAVGRSLPALQRLVGEDITLEVVPGANALVLLAQDDLDQMLTSMAIAARDLLPCGGRVVITTRLPEPLDWIAATGALGPIQPVRLEVAAEGYGVQRPAVTSSLERVVARCDGLLRARQADGHRAVFDVDLPISCAN